MLLSSKKGKCLCEFYVSDNDWGSHIVSITKFCENHQIIYDKYIEEYKKKFNNITRQYNNSPTNELVNNIINLQMDMIKFKKENLCSNHYEDVWCPCCDKILSSGRIKLHKTTKLHYRNLPTKDNEILKIAQRRVDMKKFNSMVNAGHVYGCINKFGDENTIEIHFMNPNTSEDRKKNLENNIIKTMYDSKRNFRTVTSIAKLFSPIEKYDQLIEFAFDNIKINKTNLINNKDKKYIDFIRYVDQLRDIDYSLTGHFMELCLSKILSDMTGKSLILPIEGGYRIYADPNITEKCSCVNQGAPPVGLGQPGYKLSYDSNVCLTCKKRYKIISSILSHKKYVNDISNKFNNCIKSLVIVSLGEQINYHRGLRFYINHEKIKKFIMIAHKINFDIMISYSKKIKNIPVYFSPNLSHYLNNSLLSAKADIIISDTLYEIKCVNNDVSKNRQYINQVLIYGSLCEIIVEKNGFNELKRVLNI